jgi:hypothetical protein
MKCKKLTIETDGTSPGTNVFVDGKKIGYLKSISLDVNSDEHFARILLSQIRIQNGKPVTSMRKVRQESTQKMIDTEVQEIEPLLIEFERENNA